MSEVNQNSAAVTTQAEPGATSTQSQPTEGKANVDAASATPQANQNLEKPSVPEKYELKLPEASILSAAHLEGLTQYAKEQGLSQEQAQKLVEREHSVLSEFVNGQHEEFKAQVDGWRKEVESDRELGGERLSENAEIAKRGMVEIFGPEIGKILDETGYGNNPILFRGALKLGRMLANDKMVQPGTQGAEKKSLADRLYGSNN